MKIGEKKFVTLSYTLTVDGSVADSATAENPLGFVFGAGYLLPEFEKNIDGLSAGEKFEFTLTPENGYGLPNPDMVIELPRSTFEVDGQVEEGLLTVGNQIPMMTNDGMRLIGVVASVDGDKVKMDFNHPMAGKTLNFAGEIVGVREATDEDYADAKVVLFSKLPKVFYTFYSTFITLFHQFPHNQYKPKVFLITIRTCDHDSPHTGSLYILPMYYLYAK